MFTFCFQLLSGCHTTIAPLPVVGQLRNVGVLWLVGAMAVVYIGVFLLDR
ncbi:hypothetical protein K6N65_004089 [Escherichia coli]|nr:hypothetical protein [Escherichia coli]EKX4373770.1 hypothetical protein [Escherichia coli]